MNCQHATLLIGADPYVSSPELSEHLQSCTTCAEFQREMLALETNIRRALDVTPPAVSATKAKVADIRDAQRAAAATRKRLRPVPWRGWAVAASVAAVVLASLWLVRPSDTLAHDLVAHVEREPDSWGGTRPVDLRTLQALLHRAGIADSNLTSQEVTYAQTCQFRGHFVPHVVVHTVGGPITVIVLPDEHVKGRETFSEGRYAGIIVPAQQGSLAVLTRGSAPMDAANTVAQQTWFTVGRPAQP